LIETSAPPSVIGRPGSVLIGVGEIAARHDRGTARELGAWAKEIRCRHGGVAGAVATRAPPGRRLLPFTKGQSSPRSYGAKVDRPKLHLAVLPLIAGRSRKARRPSSPWRQFSTETISQGLPPIVEGSA